MWATMEEGKTLAVAYQVGTLMGGSLAVEKEFRFSTISFKVECDILGVGELTPESDGEGRRHRLSLNKKSPRSQTGTPTRVERDIDLSASNNISDIVKQVRGGSEEIARCTCRDLPQCTTLTMAQFPERMKIVVLSNDMEHSKDLLKNLGADPSTSIALMNNPENVDIITDVCMGLIKVDPEDDRNVRRLKPLEAKMADVVVVNENVGSDSTGKRWLVTSLATALEVKGFKGVFALQVDAYDKQKVKGLQGAPNVHAVNTKEDEIERIKVHIVLAFANPKEEKMKRKLSSLKRNNSYQRPKNSGASAIQPDANVVAHRLSERTRRKSGSNIKVFGSGVGGSQTP